MSDVIHKVYIKVGWAGGLAGVQRVGVRGLGRAGTSAPAPRPAATTLPLPVVTRRPACMPTVPHSVHPCLARLGLASHKRLRKRALRRRRPPPCCWLRLLLSPATREAPQILAPAAPFLYFVWL